MSGTRIILFGATGYTGDLTARSLVDLGARPVLVARNPDRVAALADELGGLDTAVADVTDPSSLRSALQPGDVLISTVGPFLVHGQPAVQAAAELGVHYLDSTGEGPFIREVFERWGPIAEANRVVLLSGFGFDYVPGTFAAALALTEAGPDATAVDIAYFSSGFRPSGGTQASAVGVMFEEGYTFRGGALRAERPGKDVKRMTVDGRSYMAASIPAAEHFGLPQAFPQLREVTVRLGFPPAQGRAMSLTSAVLQPLSRVEPITRGISAITRRFVKGSTGGPDAAARARGTATIIATASGPGIASVTTTLRGPNPYEITADLLAWGALTVASGGALVAGAAGPVTAFGLDALTAGCAAAGLSAE